MQEGSREEVPFLICARNMSASATLAPSIVKSSPRNV